MLLAATACGGRKQPPPPAVPVTVAEAKVRPVPLSVSAVGTVEPIEAVAVKAQVGGVVDRVLFTEGDDVRAGQILFQIDPRPFRAALDAAEAQLARDRSQAANAQVQARRYAELVKKDYVTQEQHDAAQTEAQVLQSVVQADQAAVEQARLNLSWASVTSPIAGRTGSLLVKKGNLVKANEAAMVVVNQMRPIRVSFAIPGGQLPLLQRYSGSGALEVLVRPSRSGDGGVAKGRLSFVDNAVDPGTGTVTLKAEFPNEDGSLWPGQFVDTQLVLAVEPDALTVPAGAVVTGQEGTFVFVVVEGNTVEKRNVKVNRTVDGDAVLEDGLKTGDTVVTDGQLRLVPGALVEIKPGVPGVAAAPGPGAGRPS
jgi:multidrug efflux system membrane fusion protein